MEKLKMNTEDKTSVMSETAKMQKNGDIVISVLSDSAYGAKGKSEYTVIISSQDYEACRSRFGLEKPGDWKTIETIKVIGGETVTQETADAEFSLDD
jgi:hypothetical protein